MKNKDSRQMTFLENLEAPAISYGSLILNKEKTIQILEEFLNVDNLNLLKSKVYALKDTIRSYKHDREGILNINSNGDAFYRYEEMC